MDSQVDSHQSVIDYYEEKVQTDHRQRKRTQYRKIITARQKMISTITPTRYRYIIELDALKTSAS
jgi:hypothetical protein